MPRSVDQIIEDAEQLARRFLEYEPRSRDERDPQLFRNLHAAVMSRSQAEHDVRAAVLAARAGGYSWSTIGSMIGTSGEAARQRYGSAKNVA